MTENEPRKPGEPSTNRPAPDQGKQEPINPSSEKKPAKQNKE